MTQIISHHSQWNTAFAEACTAYADALSSVKQSGDLVECNSRFTMACDEYDIQTKNQTLFAGALGNLVKQTRSLADDARTNGLLALDPALESVKLNGTIDVNEEFLQRAISVARSAEKEFRYIASSC